MHVVRATPPRRALPRWLAGGIALAALALAQPAQALITVSASDTGGAIARPLDLGSPSSAVSARESGKSDSPIGQVSFAGPNSAQQSC
jgi:hypothetical protein